MKKRTSKSLLKIVAATSMSIFTLMSVFSATFAWFEMIKHVDENASSMPVEKKERFSKISYYNYTGIPTDDACSFSPTPYASITYNAATKTFSQPVNGQGQTISSFDLVMDQYDPMNKHKPILVIAELSEDVNTANSLGVQVIAKTTTTDFLGRKDANHQPKYALGSSCPLKIATVSSTDYYPLSSVVCFRTKAFSEAEYNTWTENGQASSLNVTGLSLPEEADPESTTPVQEQELTTWFSPVDRNFAEADVDADSSSFEQESTVYRSDSEGSAVVKYIAVVVDYYDLAIEYIYSAYLGNTVLEENDYILNFTCDWKWEIG